MNEVNTYWVITHKAKPAGSDPSRWFPRTDAGDNARDYEWAMSKLKEVAREANEPMNLFCVTVEEISSAKKVSREGLVVDGGKPVWEDA